jgi:hypothetical protein
VYAFDTEGADAASRASLLSHLLGLNVVPSYNKATGTYDAAAGQATLHVAVTTAMPFEYVRDNGWAETSSCQSGLAGAGLLNGSTLDGTCSLPGLSRTDSSAAIAAAKAQMRTLTLDPTTFAWSSTRTPAAIVVSAAPLVKGKAVQSDGARWTFSVLGRNVVAISGTLASLKSLGSYPLVSATAAVKRLNDPGFTSTAFSTLAVSARDLAGGFTNYSGHLVPLGAQSTTTTGNTAQKLPKSPSAGARIKWPITKVTITKARVELAPYVQPDGAVLVLPTYVLTGSDGNTYSVLALSDDSLATASR